MFPSLKRIFRRAPTYAKYIWERPGWAILIIFGRLHWARRVERFCRSTATIAPAARVDWPESSLVSAPPPSDILAALRKDGICQNLQINKDAVKDISTFADRNPCSTREKDSISFFNPDFNEFNKKRDRDILSAYYFESVQQCHAIISLQNDPLLLSIAESYIGQKVNNIRCRLWWNFPATRYSDTDLHASAQNKFHFDLNDWRTLKFFFYINDVDEFSAPHRVILGSHRKKKLRHQYTILQGKDETELANFYEPDSFQTITGAAGSGFSEDPFVFHTGSVAISRARLVLELEYGPYHPSPSYRFGVLG